VNRPNAGARHSGRRDWPTSQRLVGGLVPFRCSEWSRDARVQECRSAEWRSDVWGMQGQRLETVGAG
jgi:hypothetical protein